MCHEATILSFRPDNNKTWGTDSPASARLSNDSIGCSLFHGSNISGSIIDAALGFLKMTRAYNIIHGLVKVTIRINVFSTITAAMRVGLSAAKCSATAPPSE
jgi:hypothetical protein